MSVPRVVHELSSGRVLVTEWAEGSTATQLLAAYEAGQQGGGGGGGGGANAGAADCSPQEAHRQLLALVAMGLDCSLAQLLDSRLLHADPHPGNFMYCSGGRLMYLDFGLLVEVPEQSSQVGGAATRCLTCCSAAAR